LSLRDYVIGLIADPAGTVFCSAPSASSPVMWRASGRCFNGEADANTWALRILGLIATVGSILLRAGRLGGPGSG